MKIVWVVGEALMDLIPVNGEPVPMKRSDSQEPSEKVNATRDLLVCAVCLLWWCVVDVLLNAILD